MRLSITTAAALAFALALLAACHPRDTSAPAPDAAANMNAPAATAEVAAPVVAKQSPPPQHPAETDGVRRITEDELRAGMKKGEVAVFDVRDKVSYEAGHIKGAKLVPWGEVEKRLAEFPKNKLIVTYCA